MTEIVECELEGKYNPKEKLYSNYRRRSIRCLIMKEKKVSERAQTELMQDEVRQCLRDVISDLDGKWTNAQGLAELAKTKYPQLGEHFTGKSIGEYLKRMNLRTRTIETTFYLCQKLYADY